MHTPITTLKSAARESSEATTLIDLVRKLFGLRDAKADVREDEAAVGGGKSRMRR
jgi:hypothetical protein